MNHWEHAIQHYLTDDELHKAVAEAEADGWQVAALGTAVTGWHGETATCIIFKRPKPPGVTQ